MIGEVVEDGGCTSREVFARYTLAIEVETLCGRPSPQAKSRAKPWKHILRLERPRQIALGARRHIPVNRPRAAVGFFNTVAVGVIRVGVAPSAGDAIFLVEGVVRAGGSVVRYV